MEASKVAAKEGLNKVFTQIHKNLGLYITVIVSGAYHLFSEKDFACSCEPQNQQWVDCWLHLGLPALLLQFLMLLIDKKGFRVSKCCSKCDSPGCRHVMRVLYSVSVSLIWVAAVLVDGDWFLCCRNDGSDAQAKVACKSPDVHTEEEKSTAAHLKSRSRNWSVVVLLIAAIVRLLCSRCKMQVDEQTLAEVILEGGALVSEMQDDVTVEQLETRLKTRLEQEERRKSSNALIKEITDKNKTNGPKQTARKPRAPRTKGDSKADVAEEIPLEKIEE